MKRLAATLSFILFAFVLLAQEKEITLLPVGSKAPDFNLPGVDDRNYTLGDFSSHEILVILFTCNHCPTAQAYEDRFIKIVDEYEKKGVGFVAISPNALDAINLSELSYSDLNDGLEDMKIRARDKEYNFPYLYDGDDQKVSMAYGPVATPHAFVFDKNRNLRYSGRIDDTENPYAEPKNTDLKNALDALLAGKTPPVETTKTFGCSIKWAWKDEWTKKLLQQWAQEPVDLQDIDLAGIGDLMKNDTEKLRFVNVWATWCGPCVTEFPELVSINRMYRARGYEFVSISTDKPGKKDKALEMLKKFEASNPNYIFSGEDIYELIEAVDPEWQGALPYSALIAPGGEILYKVEGMVDLLTLKRKIVGHLGRYYADDK